MRSGSFETTRESFIDESAPDPAKYPARLSGEAMRDCKKIDALYSLYSSAFLHIKIYIYIYIKPQDPTTLWEQSDCHDRKYSLVHISGMLKIL